MTRDIVINGRFLSRRITGVERHGREILSCIGGGYRLEMTRSHGFRGHIWEQFVLPRKLNSKSVLWSPANTGPWMVQRQALTIHDLSAIENPHWFQKRFSVWYSLLIPILVKRVRILLTPSEYVKQKIIQRFGTQNVIVTPNGVNLSVFNPVAKQSRYALPPSYILFVGTLEPRKNLKLLLQAWSQIQADFKDTWLVIAGSHSNVHRPPYLSVDMERVRFIGYVDEDSLPGLYANAILFVLPSLDEGFGVPVVEAMACGAPILVSNGGALPEIVGDVGFVFDLSDQNALAEGMRQCLSNHGLRLLLKEKGLERAQNFSWQKSAELIWKTLHDI